MPAADLALAHSRQRGVLLGIRSKQGCGAKYAAMPAGTSAVPSPVDAASSPIAASAALLDHQLEN